MALIIIADDDELIRSVLREALVRCGHVVIEASNGVDCLRLMKSEAPELIIIDIFMPELDGLGTLNEVSEKWPEVKVICMSGGGSHNSLDYLDVAKEFGAYQVLKKPFKIKHVINIVSDILALPV